MIRFSTSLHMTGAQEKTRANHGVQPTRYARAHEWRLACVSFWLT